MGIYLSFNFSQVLEQRRFLSKNMLHWLHLQLDWRLELRLFLTYLRVLWSYLCAKMCFSDETLHQMTRYQWHTSDLNQRLWYKVNLIVTNKPISSKLDVSNNILETLLFIGNNSSIFKKIDIHYFLTLVFLLFYHNFGLYSDICRM